jgi:hypothetical protein
MRPRGHGGGAGGGAGTAETNTGDGGGDVSTVTGGSGERQAPRINQVEDLHCYNCSATDHWADECPELTSEQQAQLHMVVEMGKKTEEQYEGHQLLNVSFMQGESLPDNRAYLNGCSTVTAFKTDKYLKDVRTVPGGININCNAGTVTMNKVGKYGRLTVWYIPNGIANIFSMNELEKHYRIIYESWQGYYFVHTPKVEVKFHKYEHGLPYIDLEGSCQEAATMLVQMGVEGVCFTSGREVHLACRLETQTGRTHVQIMRENYDGFTKKDVIKAKEAR